MKTTTQPTDISPATARARYDAAHAAYLDALNSERDQVAGGFASDGPQVLHDLWEEYRAARAALRGPARVKGVA